MQTGGVIRQRPPQLGSYPVLLGGYILEPSLRRAAVRRRERDALSGDLDPWRGRVEPSAGLEGRFPAVVVPSLLSLVATTIAPEWSATSKEVGPGDWWLAPNPGRGCWPGAMRPCALTEKQSAPNRTRSMTMVPAGPSISHEPAMTRAGVSGTALRGVTGSNGQGPLRSRRRKAVAYSHTTRLAVPESSLPAASRISAIGANREVQGRGSPSRTSSSPISRRYVSASRC